MIYIYIYITLTNYQKLVKTYVNQRIEDFFLIATLIQQRFSKMGFIENKNSRYFCILRSNKTEILISIIFKYACIRIFRTINATSLISK